MTCRRGITTATALLLLATPLVAQSRPNTAIALDTSARVQTAAPVPTATAPIIVVRSPSPTALPLWISAPSVAPIPAMRTAAVRGMSAGSTWENEAMMIVGGAGMLTGVLVGGKVGTVVTVGGTVVGLIGFLNYLK